MFSIAFNRNTVSMLDQVLTAVATAIVDIISAFGYLGVLSLMALESACIPLPSEVIMPFAGYLASTGRFSLLGAATIGALGCNLGSTIAYYIAVKGGRKAIARWGAYVLIRPSDIDSAERFFARYGAAAVLISRLLPVVRTFISVPAGLARMPILKFQLYTFAGSWPWCFGLAYIGFVLGKNWDTNPILRSTMHRLDFIVAFVVIAAAAWFIWTRLRKIAPKHW
jgi:membrane protein DedA with SNARE-associated domain